MANFTQDRMYEMLGEISKKQKPSYKAGGLKEADCPFGYSLVNGKCVPDPDCEDGQCRETDEIQAIYDYASTIPQQVVNFERSMVNHIQDDLGGNAKLGWKEEGIKSFVEPSCMYIAGLGYRCAPATETYFKKFNPVHFNSNQGFIHAVDRGDVPFTRVGKFSDRNFDAQEKGNVQIGDIVNFKGADNSHAMTFAGYTEDGHPKYIDSNGDPADYGLGMVWRNLRPNTVGLGPDYAYVNRFNKDRFIKDTYSKEIEELEKQARENPTYYKYGGLAKFVDGGTNDCPDGYIKDENGNCIPANYNPNVANENTEFLKSMANSPLFVERYARMVGKPLEEVTQEAEDYRKQILQNLETVQMGDSAYPPQPYKMGNMEAAAYYSRMADLDKYSKSLNDVQSLINELPNKGKRNKELRASYQTIYDEAKKNYDEQLRTGHKLYFDVNEWNQPTDLHERSHASVKGNLQVANPYKHKDFSKEQYNFMKEHLETRYPENKKWYYEDDDEIKARKDVAAKIMMKLGLYDPINETFTPEHYKKLRKLMGSGELDVDTERQLEDITRPFTEEETIRMFNDIVQNTPQESSMRFGRYGGLLKFIRTR